MSNNYPPSTTDPLTLATPQRTTRLNSRGTIIPGIEFVMATLQGLYPRRIFPASGSQDCMRTPTLCPTGWRRGGTSPGGASLGGTPGGNYFVGHPEKVIGESSPQRIIWDLPSVGEEEWLPNQQVGPYVDHAIQPLSDLLVPATPSTPEHYRQMGSFAAASFAIRVIPMQVYLWGNDYDDTEELVHWFASAFQTCFNGTINGMGLLGPGGWVDDEKGTRGLHYVLTARFAAPIHYPYFGERAMSSASLRISGAAPYREGAEE